MPITPLEQRQSEGSRRRRRAVGLALVALVGGIAAAGLFFLPDFHSATAPSEPPSLLTVPPGESNSSAAQLAAAVELPYDHLPSRAAAGYVGPDVCQKCHAGIAETYQQTKHFRACRIAKPGEIPPGFEPGRNRVTASLPGLAFEMTRRGDEFYQTAIRSTPTGEERHDARIDLIYGAGGSADDVFLSWRDDDHLVELPTVWLYGPAHWGTSHFDPHGFGDFSRALTVRCLECHNTWVQHVPGTANQYRRTDALLSVTCESCHGPGRDHVAYHEAHPDETIGQAIVQPGSLDRDRQLDVCLQCHSNAINRKQAAFSYRPGEPLDDYFRTLTVEHNEDDHVANQIQYLRQSKCFQKSDDLTCTTCHDPHRAKGADNAGSLSCRKCHEPDACHDRPKLPSAVQDDCVGCHMRPYLKINVNFETEDDNFVVPFRRYDHRIAVNPVARQEVLLRWHREQPSEDSRQEVQRLSASLVEHWKKEAQQLRGEHRYLAAIAALREAVSVADSPELRRELEAAVETQASIDQEWARALLSIRQNRSTQAIDSLRKILSLQPDDAKAHGRLGTQYAQTGDRSRAVEHLEAVATSDPDDAYGHAMLGWLAYLDGNASAALEHYRRAEEIEPFEAKIHYHTGLALARLQRLSEAADRFRKVLTIEPQHLAASEGLVAVLRQQRDFPEAIALCLRAAKLTDQKNIDVLMTLAMTYSEAGEREAAIQAANQAREVAQDQRSPKLPLILQVLASLQNSGG